MLLSRWASPLGSRRSQAATIMETSEFLNLNQENLSREHLCCIIRSRTLHEGVEKKRGWLSERLREGHVFRKLNAKATVFIEYAPLEKAWVPIVGDNYYYIYCLWVTGGHKGKGYGKELLEYCISDAQENGKSGICLLGSQKQKHWLTDQSFAKKHGFRTVDSTENGYELLALSWDGTQPRFTDRSRRSTIESQELTVYYDLQCPYIPQSLETVKTHCVNKGIPVLFHEVSTLQQAKDLPCVFNNWGVFFRGRFETVNLLLDTNVIDRITNK